MINTTIGIRLSHSSGNQMAKSSLIAQWSVYCVCLIAIKRTPIWTIEQYNTVCTRIKIMWEEQLLDPPNEYIVSVLWELLEKLTCVQVVTNWLYSVAQMCIWEECLLARMSAPSYLTSWDKVSSQHLYCLVIIKLISSKVHWLVIFVLFTFYLASF